MPARATAPIRQADLIEGLGKGLRVIESFDEEHPRLSASEAAERAQITRTAARRYLLSLVHFGYADTDGKHFWLAPRVLRLGQSYLSAARLPRLVQPFMQRLSQELGENINFSIVDEHEVVYVARSLSNQMISIGFPVGARVPAHVVTPGVAILSTWSEARLSTWIAAHEFGAYTPRTTTDPQRFRDDVLAARQLGYWVAEQQLNPGLRGLAMPVKNRRGSCVGAIGLTTTMQPRTREALIEGAVPRITDVVQLLGNIL